MIVKILLIQTILSVLYLFVKCQNEEVEEEVKHNYFYEDIKPDPTEYDLFDTFDGYLWHQFQHSD